MTAAILLRNSVAATVGLLLSASVLTAASDCDEWNRRVAALPAAAGIQLRSYGAFNDGEWLLFSDKLVKPCEQRAVFSRYAGDAIHDLRTPSVQDVAMVAAKSDEFVGVLMAIWPTNGKNFPGEDGAFRDQLPELLIREELSARSMRPLLKKILRHDGISADLAFALMTRPDPGLRVSIRAHVFAKGRVVDADIYAVAILQALGDDVSHQLRMLLRSQLSPGQRSVLQVLDAKFRAHTPPVWDDVLDLETQ